MKTYEGMFLFDPTFASDLTAARTEIERILQRAEAELIVCKKWEERRLAYTIKGHKRGCYVLTYFKAPPDSIPAIERDTRLSEHILRLLILRADDITEEKMNAPVPADQAVAPAPAPDKQEAGGKTPAPAQEADVPDVVAVEEAPDEKPEAEVSAEIEADA